MHTPTPTPRDLLLLGKLDKAADAAEASTKAHTADGRVPLLVMHARMGLSTDRADKVENFIRYCERINEQMAH